MKAFVRDNALGLAFGAAFLLTLAGQSVAGLVDFNNQQIADGTDPVGYLPYVMSSSFAVDVAENWQSEYLQFILYVFGTVWLFQRGSPESKPLHQLGRESDRDQVRCGTSPVGVSITGSSCARPGLPGLAWPIEVIPGCGTTARPPHGTTASLHRPHSP